MLTVSDLPLCAELPADDVAMLTGAAERRLVRAGQHVLRRGTRGRHLFAVASGGLRVVRGVDVPVIRLGPGAFVGEMSLLAGQPVSAHVLAEKDSHLWVWPRATALTLLEASPALRGALTGLVAQRLAARPLNDGLDGPQLALVEAPADTRLAAAWIDGLSRACRGLVGEGAVTVLPPQVPRELASAVETWRDGAPPGGLLLVALPTPALGALRDQLRDGDAVVRQVDDAEAQATGVVASFGLADHADVSRGRRRSDPLSRWTFRLRPGELGDGPPDDAGAPELCRLARWLTRRQVGVALSAGAARGFAHVGVLAELRRLGLPVDRLAGTSMGGVAALMYGMADDPEQAIEKIVWTLGRPHRRRWNWLGRTSLLSDRELQKRAATIAEGRHLGDLSVPVSVVTSDLVRGERVVLDRGPVSEAFFATGAVPGVLPPVNRDDRVLVDGALVSRLPVDLLPPRRCGLRIAVNVIPPPPSAQDTARQAAELRARMARPFGFARALSASWRLLSWWHGARDAADADVLIEPETDAHSGLDFAESWEPLVESGRAAVRAQADELLAAAPDLVLRPGDPD